MTDMPEQGSDALNFPQSFEDYLKFAAAETKIAEEGLRYAMEKFPPSRADLVNIIWHQAGQNMALLETVVALVINDREKVVASADNLIKTMRDGFNAMAKVSAELTKAGMQDANAARGGVSRE